MYTISDINYTIAGPFLTLDFVYIVLTIVALLRFATVYQMKDRFALGLIFYLSIAIHCLYRVGTFQATTILSIDAINETDIRKISEITQNIAILIYSSDITFWIIFLIFFWQLVVLLYVGHISLKSATFSDKENTPPPLKVKAILLFLFIIFIYLTFQIILIALYSGDIFSINVYIFINSISNLAVPLWIGLSEAYYHKKFSGLPYKSLFFQRRKRKLNLRIVYWAFGRTFHGILDLIVLNFNQIGTYIKFPSDPTHISDYDYSMMTISVLIVLIDKLMFEIFPFLLVFDIDFVKVFFKINDKEIAELNNDITDDLIDQNLKEAHKSINESHHKIIEKEPSEHNSRIQGGNSKNSTFIEKELEVNKYEFSSLKFQDSEDYNQKKNAIGRIKMALISENPAEIGPDGSFMSINSSNTEKVSARCLDLNDLSSYLTDEIMKDLKNYYKIQNDPDLSLAMLKGYSIRNHELYLIFEDYSHGSLTSLIRQSNEKSGILSFQLKAKFASQIANSMRDLHNRTPPIVHGHLNSNNILLDKDFFPKIADFFFHDLKKFLALSKGYTNKTAFTAPEYLKENSAIVSNPKKEGDVYSFGMILWELFVEKEPFQGIKLKELKKIVIDENSRPKIPEMMPFYIANLIRCCWQQEPEKRPNFTEISECLESHFLLKHELSNSSVAGT